MKTKAAFLVAVLAVLPGAAGAAARGPLSTYLVEPCRFLDTREQAPSFDTGALVGVVNRRYLVQGSCEVPAFGVAAVILNVTVTGATAAGHLTLWRSDAYAPPATSNLNFGPGQTIANGMTVMLGEVVPGSPLTDLFVQGHVPDGQVHVIVDVVGYLAP